MRKKIIIFFYLLFYTCVGSAQISENFNDGDFLNNPAWIGNTADFIVNTAYQLQSNNTVANSSFYLSTANSIATSAQWEFWVRIAFNPSSTNYVDAYLTASSSNLSLTSTYGYFVRIGNTDDEICLYRKDATGAITKIIGGEKGILNKSNNVMKIKVIRDINNQWMLMRDLTGTGNFYTSEGSVTDGTYTTSVLFWFFDKTKYSQFFPKAFFR